MKRFLITTAVLAAVVATQVGMELANAAEVVYKTRLRDAATGNAGQASIFSSGDLDREEWVVLTVIDNKQVRVRHTTSIRDKFFGTRRWHDHPATAMRVCISDGFESKDCQTVKGDTAAIPAGKTILDLAIDFKYSEGGALYTRSIQLTPDIKPESTEASNSR